MTLVQLAEYLINNNEMVYDEEGSCISCRCNIKDHKYILDYSINKLHDFYSVAENGKLHTLGVEGNAIFCLLVNESMK